MTQGDSAGSVLPSERTVGEDHAAQTSVGRRGDPRALAIVAILLTLLASVTFAGYAVVIGLPVELVAVACAIWVVVLTQRGSRRRRWAWALVAFTMIPICLTAAYFLSIY